MTGRNKDDRELVRKEVGYQKLSKMHMIIKVAEKLPTSRSIDSYCSDEQTKVNIFSATLFLTHELIFSHSFNTLLPSRLFWPFCICPFFNLCSLYLTFIVFCSFVVGPFVLSLGYLVIDSL